MNKYYNGLLVVTIVCSMANGLVVLGASENPAANKSTFEAVKETSKNYALGYAGFFSLAIVDGAIVGRRMQKEYLAKGNAIQKLIVTSFSNGNPILTCMGIRCAQVARTTPVTLPIVMIPTIAYHSYKNFDNSEKINQIK